MSSPLDGSELGPYPATGTDEVRAAVARARAAQEGWWALSQVERLAHMRRLARALGGARRRLVEVIRRETGKPEADAEAEILVSVELIRHYLETAPGVLGMRGAATRWLVGKAAYTVREPYGVIGVITPWNYPLVLVLDTVVAALFGGNGVVVKPSEHTPGTALAAAELLTEAGLPDGLVQVVTGDGSTGAALVTSGVDKVVFTGSTATGRRVMAAAAQGPTPVALELGGKDPALVLEDADLERAAAGVAFGAFFNAGQTCISTERVYVVRDVYDDFLRRVIAVAKGLRTGVDAESDVGPIITEAQREVIRRHLREAVEAGARVEVGGEPDDPEARFFPPTVLSGARDDMKILTEETFGPVLPVVAVADEEEALRRANATDYGLFASVWTGDLARGERIARRLRAGGVSVNDTLSHYGVPGLPVGGVGASGFGHRRGAAGLEELTRPRAVLVHRRGFRLEPWWFPYGRRNARMMEALVVLRSQGWLRGLAEAVRVLRGRGRR